MSGAKRFLPIEDIPESARGLLAMSWQMRALLLLEEAAKRTNGSDKMFRVMCAALHKNPPGLPIYSPAARIDRRGMLWAEVCSGEDVNARPAATWQPIMRKTELVGKVQDIVDALDLSLAEAQAMIKEVSAWIYEDLSEGQLRAEDRIPAHLRNKRVVKEIDTPD